MIELHCHTSFVSEMHDWQATIVIKLQCRAGFVGEVHDWQAAFMIKLQCHAGFVGEVHDWQAAFVIKLQCRAGFVGEVHDWQAAFVIKLQCHASLFVKCMIDKQPLRRTYNWLTAIVIHKQCLQQTSCMRDWQPHRMTATHHEWQTVVPLASPYHWT